MSRSLFKSEEDCKPLKRRKSCIENGSVLEDIGKIKSHSDTETDKVAAKSPIRQLYDGLSHLYSKLTSIPLTSDSESEKPSLLKSVLTGEADSVLKNHIENGDLSGDDDDEMLDVEEEKTVMTNGGLHNGTSSVGKGKKSKF